MPDPSFAGSNKNMNEDNNLPDQARPTSLISQIALILAALAFAATVWQWLDSRQRTIVLEQTLTQRLSQFDERNREVRVLSKLTEESAAQAEAKVTLLEQRLEESRSQQEALQTLYLELANNRDEWTISEVEQLLIVASQQLQLAGNAKPALLALQTADARLQQLDKPQVIALRKIIGRDIQRLQALPSVDTVGISLKLESLVDAADKLPLISERHPQSDQPLLPDWDSNPWRRLTQEIWQDIKRMVRVERMDEPEPPLLEPEQAYFLRENLKLRLLTARIALLQHDESTYRADLQLAGNWLKRYFNTQDSAGRNALTALEQLSSSDISIELPDIGESLNAVAKYKLSLDRKQP
jgi:uroporphyrin-III C-methyltransferase